MNNHQRWTQSQIDDLRARAQAGEAADLIAEALGRTLSDTVAMADRLRLRVA